MKRKLSLFLVLIILLSLALPLNAFALPNFPKKATAADVYLGSNGSIYVGPPGGSLADSDYRIAITDVKLNGVSIPGGMNQYWRKDHTTNSIIIDSYVLQAVGSYEFTLVATNYFDQTVTLKVLDLKNPPYLKLRSTPLLGDEVHLIAFGEDEYFAGITGIKVSGVSVKSEDITLKNSSLILSKDIFQAVGSYQIVVYSKNYKEFSREVTVHPANAANPPTDLKAVISNQVPLLTWKDNSSIETGFNIHRSLDGGTTWTKAGEVGVNTTQFLDSGAPGGKSCTYYVNASFPTEDEFVPHSLSSNKVTIAVPEKTEGTMDNFVVKNTYKSGQFTDVNENLWYGFNQQKVIARAYEYGLMKGATATTFNPNGNFSIAEAITVAARVRSIYTTGKENFIQGAPWYQVYVDYALANGIIKAGDFTNYDVAATRAQMAYIFSNALPISCYPMRMAGTVKTPPDVNASTPYQPSILSLYAAGILGGSDDKGTFNPYNNINRAEASAIVSRLILPDMRLGIPFMPS